MIIRDFKLNEVELNDGYLSNAFRLEQDYLLSLEADRLLAGFYEIAGKQPKAKRYPGGWEDQDIAGHTMGHYLTALAQAYASNGNKKLLERLTYVVDSLAECQAESGYLSAFREELFDNLEQGKQAWVPWYTMHKILAGLISAYQLTALPKALDVAIRLGTWVAGRVNRWDDAMKAQVLATEYGGMNDCLYELYKESGRIEFMMAAEKFDELPLFQEINNDNDILDGRHANTTIPKFLGALNRYLTVGEEEEFYLDCARKFFDMVVQYHTYVTGGNSEWEHFGAPKILADERTNCNCETCNTYNMLKLARGLFKVTGEKKYLDFYEGTFWNAIVSSQNPKTGMAMYFQPMATGYFKVFSRPFDNFWCCTGTGMENFTKLNDSIYYIKDETIYLGMYISSRLKNETLGIELKMTADLPANPVVKVVVEKESEGETKLAFRKPEWSKNGFSVTRKGKNLKTEERGGFVYVSVDKGTTEIEAVFMPEVAIHELPDNPNVVAFTYGHLVLSAGLGKEEMVSSTTGVNVTVPTKEIAIKDTLTILAGTVEEWKQNPDKILVRQGNTLNFKLSGTDEDKNLVFSPHYARFEERYGIYWELVQGEELVQNMPETKPKKKSNKGLMAVLLVIVLFLLLVTGFFMALEVSESFRNAVLGRFNGLQTGGDNSGNPIQVTETPTPTAEPSGDGSGETVVVPPTEAPIVFPGISSKELGKEAGIANASDLRGFTAIVENINSRQYLTFYNDTYKVSYKFDEMPLIYSAFSVNEVIISNGEKTETFYWDYVLKEGEAAKLCPYVGDFCKNGREQLAFSFLEKESDAADTLHVVAGNTLQEYYVIRPEATLNNLIKVNGYLDAGNKVLADLTSDNRNYYVVLDDCLLDIAEEVYAIKPDSKLTYEITEDGIILQSFVEISNGQYIGRIRGNISYSSRDVFRLSSPSFYAFAEDDFCDVDSMGIVTPVGEAELNLTRIPITGDGGERLLVRARTEIPFNDRKAENFRYNENGFLEYYENNVKVSLTGIDVSKWQYDINWKKVAAAGVDYAIIRLGYRGTAAAGNCAMDQYFEQNIKGALDAGLQVGVYYFTQAITVEEAIEEANIVIDALKGYNVTFPVVYDTEYREDGRANDLPNELRTACAKAFCDTVLAAGYTPAVYSSTNWSILDLNLEDLQNYDMWYAYYGQPEDLYFPYEYTMWQYTDKGKVDGIDTNVDLNISFMDYSTR